MQGLIDTHCHLDMLKAEIPEILSSAKEAGVEKVITISVDEKSQKRVLELSRNWPNVFGTLGVHPHSASEYHPGISDQIRNAFSEQKLRGQDESPKLLAIGEAGLDYRDVALWNGLQPPYTLAIGDKVELNPGRVNTQNTVVTPAATLSTTAVVVSEEPVETSETLSDSSVQVNQPEEPVAAPGGKPWVWPANGELLSPFSPDDGRNGIDIAGSDGSPIRAAAEGKVVYAGTGLRGYGLLIIIKHDETFLTAYAHNRAVMISEGDAVESGQIIAEMGQSGADSVRLHFEIRRDGQPVDPLEYLPDS